MILTTSLLATCGLLILLLIEAHKERSSTIARPPLYLLSRITRLFFSMDSNERVFDAIIADTYHSYIEALKENNLPKALIVRLRGSLFFLASMALIALGPLFKLIEKVKKAAS